MIIYLIFFNKTVLGVLIMFFDLLMTTQFTFMVGLLAMLDGAYFFT